MAEKKTFYVYDADEHDYEGRVVWSSDAKIYDEDGKPHGIFIWHMPANMLESSYASSWTETTFNG